MKRASMSVRVGLAIALLLCVHTVRAASYSFNGGTSTNWNTAANWTPVGVPGSGDTVDIDSSVYAKIPEIKSGSLTVTVLNITGSGGTGDTSNYGYLQIDSGATLTVTSAITLTQGNINDPTLGLATLVIPSTCTVNSFNSDASAVPVGFNLLQCRTLNAGTIIVNTGIAAFHNGGASVPPSTNSGTITSLSGGEFGFGNNSTTVNTGIFTGNVYVSGTLTLNTNYTYAGTMKLGAAFPGVLNGAGSLTCNKILKVTVNDGTISLPVVVTNTGQLNVSAYTLDIDAGVTCNGTANLSSFAVVNVNTGSTLTCNGAVTFDTSDFGGNGTLSIGAASSLTNINTQTGSNSYNTVGCVCHCAGPVTVQSGTLEFDGGGSCSNTMTIPAAASLTQLGFGGGTFAIVSPGTFAGVGGQVYVANATLQIDSNISYGGLVYLDGGGANQQGVVTGSGSLTITSGGLLSANETGDALSVPTSINSGASLVVNPGSLAVGANVICDGALKLTTGTLNIASGVTVTCTAAVSQNKSSFAGAGTLSIAATSTLTSKNTLTGASSFNFIDCVVNNAGAVVVQSGTLQVENGNGGISTGSITIGAGTQFGIFNGVFGNTGLISGAGGTLYVANATLNLNAPLSFDGILELDGNPSEPGTVAGVGPLTITGTLSSAAVGDALNTPATIANTGNIIVSNGTLLLDADVTCNGAASIANGSIDIGTGLTLTCNGAATLGTNASFGGGGTLALSSTGTLSGAGSVGGDLVSAGQVNLGATPGVLAIAGNYTQSASGTLLLKIGGTASGQFDRIQLSGASSSATLDGTLSLSLINSFTPAATDAFDILTFASRSGTFATLVSGGSSLAPVYGPTRVTLADGPPAITSPTSATGEQGQAFSYIITSNAPATYTITGVLPPGLTSNANSISGTPTTVGTYNLVLSATDTLGTGNSPLTLIVNPPPPVIGSAATAIGMVGQAFNYTITASNSPTSFNATGLPAGLSVDTSTGIISGTPTAVAVTSIAISATNAGGTGSATLTLTVNPPPPAITSATSATGMVGLSFNYTIAATNSPTSFNATGLPAGLAVDTTSGVISGTPTTSAIIDITLSATNAGGTGTATLVLTINPPPPVIGSSTSATNTVGQAFNYTIAASNSPTSFNATGLPAGLSVDTSTGIISGTPTTVAVTSIAISATNAGGTGSATLTLTVNPPPPAITSATSATGMVGLSFNYTIAATHSPTSFNAAGLPAGLAVDTASGVISGTPTTSAIIDITLSATNAGGTGTATLMLTINPPPPVIGSSTSATHTVGQAFNYTIAASNSPTSFNATGLPAGLSVDTSTGIISGTPSTVAVTSISISATNAGGTGSATLTLTVNPNPPAITSATSATGMVGQAFSYTIAATNTPASFGATGLPAGLSFNTATGTISGSPIIAATSNITLSATNAGGTGIATLILTVNPLPPAIDSAASATGTVGQSFGYTITATNTPVSFSATGLPAGLAIDTATGIISGTPTVAAVSNIEIGASNAGGTGTANLILTVAPAAAIPAPIINSVLTANATEGGAFSYRISTANNVPATFGATSLPAGLTLTGSLITGTPSVAGEAQILLTATNASGSDSRLLTLVIANTSGAASAPPVLASPPTVSAEQAVAGTPISFSAAATDSAGNLLAYTWDFGDGTTGIGSTVAKTFTAPGIYTVTLTVTDGANATTSVQNVAIDSSDSIANGATTPFAIKKASLKFNFASANKDSLGFAGTINLPAGYKTTGLSLSIDIAGFQEKSTLDGKGMSADKSFRLSGKFKSGALIAAGAKITFKTSNQSLFGPLQSAGFTRTANNPALVVPVILGLGADNFAANLTLNYVVKSNKAGPATGTGMQK